MEQKEWFQMPKGLLDIRVWFRWFESEIVRNANKMWSVEVPQGTGVAVFRDSNNKVTLDLSKVTFGAGPTIHINNSDGYLAITEFPSGTFDVEIEPTKLLVFTMCKNGVPTDYEIVSTEL